MKARRGPTLLTRVRNGLVLVAACADMAVALAQGGPPLITDDPDTPGDGHWEINFGGTEQASKGAQSGDFLHVDANYGLGNKTQLKYETGFSYFRSGDEHKQGMGDSLFGVKYRFFESGTETEGWRISTYPQVETRRPFGASDAELTTARTLYYLPIEVKEGLGPLAFVADAARELTAGGGAGWFGGFAVGYTPVQHWEMIGEVHSQTSALCPLEGRLAQIGSRVELSEEWTAMAALGRLVSDAAGAGTSTVGYIGLRWAK